MIYWIYAFIGGAAIGIIGNNLEISAPYILVSSFIYGIGIAMIENQERNKDV